MTKQEIRQRMLASVQSTLEEKLENIEELIDEDDIDEFMWSMDYGMDLAEEFIDENKGGIIADYLREIYNDISADDLESPF